MSTIDFGKVSKEKFVDNLEAGFVFFEYPINKQPSWSTSSLFGKFRKPAYCSMSLWDVALRHWLSIFI